jgi:hypothetical protein
MSNFVEGCKMFYTGIIYYNLQFTDYVKKFQVRDDMICIDLIEI